MKLFFQNNATYTRGALLALFAGLFILAACGGGGVTIAPTIIVTNPQEDNPCVTNPFGSTCTEEKVVAIDLCRMAIAGGDDCADNTPESVVSCLTDPFSAACTTAHATENPFEGTEITVANEQEKRQAACLRSDTTVLCGTAVSRLCSANPFTQTTGDTPTNLCVDITGTAYDDARDNACLEQGAADAGTGNDCNTRENVRLLCNTNPFTKPTVNTGVELCNGTNADTSEADSVARTRICTTADAGSFRIECNSNAYGDEDTARDTYCKTSAQPNDSNCDNSNRTATICTTSGGSTPFAPLCGTDTAEQLEACKGAINTLPVSGTSCAREKLSGVICGTSATDTGTNPFAEICSVQGQNVNFANLDTVQELDCRTNGSAGDGMPLGKCATIKDKFCDGADVGDNPYATVCGGAANSANQETFCTNHGTTGTTNIGLCTNSLATLCPSDPFRSDGTAECLGNGLYANQRADQCSKNTQGSGDCDTTTISDAVCITSGTYANPFATFCADGTDERTDTTTMTIAEVRQAVYTACLGNSDTGVCANTNSARDALRDTDCVATNPDKLFADGCNYTQFRDVEVDYCDEAATTWEDRCNDVMSETDVETARNDACLADGTNSSTGNGDADCANRANVRDACDKDVYKKTGNDVSELLCTGTSDDVALGSEAYSALRIECEKNDVGSFATYCDTQDNDGKVKTARDNYCRDVAPALDTNCGGVRGSTNRIALICTADTGTSVFSGVCGTDTAGQLEACKGALNTLPVSGTSCAREKLSGVICGTSATDTGTDPFAEICSVQGQNVNFANLDTVQELDCRTNGSAGDGMPLGKCETIKDKFCDGADVGDNPYAPVCGGTANSANQETFCTNHGTTGQTNIGLCTNSLATLCPSDPFRNSGGVDCLGNGLYANQRAEQCSKNTQGGGNCNTNLIEATVCASTGDYANPFAAFCGDEEGDSTSSNIASVIQAVLSACPAGSDTAGVCANTTMDRNTLRTDTCIVGEPTNLFGPKCDYEEFKTVEVDYCADVSRTWLIACDDGNVADIANRIKDTRDTVCLEQGAAGAGTGNDCNTRENVRLLCNTNPFTKPTVNTGVELCNGTNADTSEADSAARTRICTTADAGSFRIECNSNAYGDEDTARDTYCKTSAQPDDSNCDNSNRTATICTTSGGSTPFAPLCGTDTAEQLEACKGALNTLPVSGTSCAREKLSGVICGTSATDTGTNPFAEICSVQGQNVNFANLDTVQELDCRTNGSAGDGMPLGKCATIKDKFCDGADVGDNPYATVCGGAANSANQETFCTNHGTTGSTNIGLCTNSLATLCPSDPFRNSGGVDCLGNGLYANQRAEQCSKNTQGGGNCNTNLIEATVCASTGDYANPFAAFCGDEEGDSTSSNIASVIQAVLSACPAGSDTAGVCANTTMDRNTLRTETCIVGNPTALFAAECDYTEFESVEVDYCENPATTWDNTACDNEVAYGSTKTTRNNACLDYGIGADGDASCANRKNVRTACDRNPFTKTREGTPTDLCTGMEVVNKPAGKTGRLYSAIRTDICTTATVRSFHESCNGNAYGDAVTARNDYCTHNASLGDAKCQETGLTDKFCGTTGSEINVFATVCTDARRVTYCETRVSESVCADTITTFCRSASDTDLFSPICNTGTLKANFNDYRVAACSATDERTGVYIACTGILTTHCTNGSSPACKPAVDSLPASFWAAAARNADNNGTLNVLDEVGLDDAYTNYVQGGENGLNLGAFAKGDGTIIDSDFENDIDVIFEGGNLALNDLDHLAVDENDDLSDGVAFAFIDVLNFFDEENGFTDNALGRVDTRGRYYAGLFSGTDLGGPLTSVDGTAIWNARFAGYLSAAGGVVDDVRTSLLINFTDKEINTRDVDDPVDMFGGAGRISIDGEFTDAGVIFGTSSWTAETRAGNGEASSKTASGTVTGLIGKYGAVGAFVSSGTNDGIFEYAGGFVAAPVNCTNAVTGTPFHRLCDKDDPDVIDARDMRCDATPSNSFSSTCAPYTEPHQKTAFAEACRTAPNTNGCDRVIDEPRGLTVNSCTSTTGNHPHQVGCEDEGFTAQRERRIAHCLIAINAGTAECTPGTVTAITGPCGLNPFATICAPYATEYKTARDNTCLDYGIGADGDASCENRKNVRSACSKNLFMKTRKGTPTDLCIGTDATGRLYSDIRTQICTTPTVRSFHESCNGGAYGDAETARNNYCIHNAPFGDAKCQEEGLTDKFCGTTGSEINVFATVCTDARRVTFCRINVANPSCEDTITTFCSSASDTDLFAPICNTGTLKANFNDYRVAACSATDERTGVYNACTGILNMYCPQTGTRSPSCAPVVGTLPASVWVANARNANDTARLNVLDEVGLNDAYTNYVQGGENGLNLGAFAKGDGTIIDSDFENDIDVIFEGGNLALNDLDHLAVDENDDLSDGVAFAFIDVLNFFDEENGFTDNALGRVDTRGRYYAGLFSGTDLGGPLTSVDGTAIWNARFAGYLSAAGGVVDDVRTSLLINFTDKEINTRDVDDPVDMFGGAGRISIDGEFTDAGVIFGTSSWTAETRAGNGEASSKTASGTVTGLIGKYGAVGAFVSSGENDGIFEYAGGFVAAPVDCTQTGTPFHRLCTNNLANQRDFCRADTDNELCPMTIANFCGDSANDIFDSLCTVTAGTYDFARGKKCVADGTTGGDCGDEDSGYIKTYCGTEAGKTNVTNCPDKYLAANPVNRDTDVVDVSDLVVVNESAKTVTNKALNSEGTGLLPTFIANGEANTATDDRTNFIVGGVGGLHLGAIDQTNRSTFRLTNPQSGFAVARTTDARIQHYYYVGLLSGTDVGGLLPTADVPITLEWQAKLTILLGVALQPEQTFTLRVELSDQTISGSTTGIFGFAINGDFTDNGLLYGRFVSNIAGAGTLTGLIGQKGAVGIFKSNPGSTHYVGGFVANASTNCSAVGTPFHADCTDYDLQAELCDNHDNVQVANFNANCRDNIEVTSRVCAFTTETHANPFNKDICTGAGNDLERARFCFRRISPFGDFGISRLEGFDATRDCGGDPVVRAQVCRVHGAYANPFDLQVCPDSDESSVAVRARLCSNNDIRPVTEFDSRCSNNQAVTNVVCIPIGPSANPFNKDICPDDTTTTNSNNMARAQACRDRTLPDGVNVLVDCAGDSAITDLICATSGASANPFDRDICTSDQTNNQTAFVNNCRLDNAEGSITTNANGANCSRYTDCAENPYQATCDADNYHVERANYANQFVESCLGVNGATAPVGAPDSCADELAQATICASSGEYANPFNTEICPDGYEDIAAIQSEFATMCYNTRTDLRNNPECENIATCFASAKLGVASATSTTGGIACDSAAFRGVVALENTLAACDGQVSGQTLTGTCVQETITKACNANPFSEIENGKGIDCLSDTALNARREGVCINDDTNPAYNCSATTTRVCVTDNNPFSDLCYDNATYEQARYDTCDGISGDITPNTVRTNEDNTLQNCLDTIDYECQYSETEQFTNRFCKIGTLYDAERGRVCLYGHTDVDKDNVIIPTPAECTDDTIYATAYCSDLAPEADTECSTSITNGICDLGGTNVFATLCGENLAAQTEFCIVGTTTIFDTRCASADGLTQTIAGTNNARREACGGNEGEVNRATDAQCVDTVLRVCGSETGQLNTPFHAACRRKNEDGTYVYQAYVVARAEACFVQGFSPPTGTCGTEDLGTHIKEYCATDAGNTNITHCPKKYAGANPVNIGDTADVATLTAKALNAEGTALLPTFIADGAANTATDDDGVSVEDSASSFIDGGATGLNLGDAVTENTDDAVTETLTDTRDGFAIATAGTADTRKYYVGILSGTDVGAPFTEASTLTFVLWSGRLRITTPNKGGVISTITFNVNVGKKTFKLAGGAFNISTKFPELKSIDIDGKFTANGLLYGRIVIKDKDDGLNDGTLTGLIGVRGAVGIFASDDDATTTYVGGFAVENGDYELVDCLATGTPFHSFCDNDVKLELCGGTLDVLNVAMGGGPTFLPAAVAGSPAACNAADLSGVICASSGTQANPFAPICSEDTATAIISGYDQATTQLDFVNNCDTGLSALDGATCSMEITDCLANLFGSGCDAPQYATVRNTFCTKTDIFDERCGEIATEVDIVDGTNMARDMVCAKYGVSAGGHSSCETRPNVRMACDRNPFTKITADGITDLCTGTDVDGVDGVNYSEARDACKVPETSFAENCNSQDNIGKVKTARDMACEESGIAAGMDIMAVNDCATRQNIMDTCTTASPFTNKGCDTATHITREIREAYCTNGTTDIFNPKCGLLTDTTDIIGGTNEAREMACLNSQISMPIDESCKTNVRVVMACTTDPFTKVGCGNVNTIVGIRRTFCTITDIFNPNCGDTDEHGPTNEARRDVCLADTGTPSDPSCRTNALAEDICEPNPFNEAKPGCANLDKNFQYRNAYCTMGLNIFSDNCGNEDKYGATNAARDSAIRGCITPDDTRLEEGICINAVKANPCIETPFGSNCVDDFADYYQDARTIRTTFCAGLAHNNHSLCVGAIAANPCFNNPFNLDNGPTSCSSEFADRREVLINKCIVNDVGQTNDCNNVRAGIGGCLENPFQDSCEAADNFYFKDYADSGRAARVAFCDIDGDDIRTHAYCPAGLMFERDICTYNPYGSFCKDDSFDAGLNTTVEAQRTKKIIDCGDNTYKYPGSCVHVFAWATAATWALGEDGEDGRPFNTEPTAKNQFLRTTSVSELDKTGASSTSGAILNLTTATFDYKEIGGDTHDGVEFFQGVVDSSEYYYAGILGAANLGSPLSGAPRTMYWNGQISSTRSIGTTDSKTSGTNSKDFTTSDAGGVIVATDFTLTINFDGSGGTVESFTKAFLDDSTSKYYYDIEGTFNERGLITSGTVAYAVFTDGDEDSRVADSITDATLSGIIGEDGALGVFQGADFAGGFVVHSTFKARVESADWELSFDTAPLITPTAKNQFLREGEDGPDTSSITITQNGADAPVFTNLVLNESVRNRISNQVFWFSGFIGSTQYHYAGLSGLAYLDAPLTPATPSGTWYGKFRVGEHTTDFALDIAFARRNGISGGTISAFVRESAGIYYLLEGYFDRAGVITGTVNYGAFTNGVRTDAEAGRGTNGFLTGLIGQGGALGAFHSTALGAAGYAGGFYAHPTETAFGTVADYADWVRSLEDDTPSDVDYADWERSFLFLADEPDTRTPQNQFLKTKGGISTSHTTATQAGGTVPTVSTLDLTATNFDGGVLGGVNTNRVDWFSGYIGATQYHYAGVFEDARRLGTPLTETPAGGEWRGVIGVGGLKTDFTLTITYGATGGTISAFVRDTPNVYYLLDGGFDANGLIDGTVRYGAFTNPSTAVGTTVDGVLTGLIGADGALGVFHSTDTGAAGYSGGFVARPNAPEYAVAVKYSDYRRGFLTLDAPDTTTAKNNQFVTDRAGVMTKKTGQGGTNITQNTLALNTNTFDGVALGGAAGNSLFWFDGFVDGGMRRYYAGLDTTVDLGAPISGRSDTAQWRGVFGAGIAKTDFTLNITFTATGGTVAAFVHELEDNYYLLDGEFDAHGLITGTIKYGEFTNPSTAVGTTVDGVLIGLISADDAIGAFYSTTTGTSGYSGGFVVRDNVAAFDDTTVRYETWARGFLLADTPDESKPRNQFLRAKADGTLDITDGNNSTIIDLNTATFNGSSIGGLLANRYQSFDRTIGGTSLYYLGILPNTDLGGRVTQDNTTELTWYGNFRGGFDGALTHVSDFILYLTIDGAVGTLSARVNHHNTNYYVLDGTFDASGVITGTIAYNLSSFEEDTTNGILTGLIGVNGAIGVFYGNDNTRNYGGGFVAKPKTLTFTDSVGYADWMGRANPASTPTAKNQFLQTTNGTINTGDTSDPAEFFLDLNTTNFDGAPILGDINDGVAYFRGTIGETAYAYAGIFDSTDLGAPLTQTSQSFEWRGVVGLNGDRKRANFTINFNGKIGTITAFITNIIARNDLLIAGGFDDLGLIRGAVHYAEFVGNTPTGIATPNGTLSGIIGQEGAVAAFYGTDGSNVNYSGGFIASAGVRAQVNASAWRNKFKGGGLLDLPETSETSPTPGITQSQFLDGSKTSKTDYDALLTGPAPFTLGLGSKSGADETTYKSIPLGGDNTGGIGYFYGTQSGSSRLHYAYLNHDSKIGTRIEDTEGTAEYHGQFSAIARGFDTGVTLSSQPDYITNTDFTLTVSFGRGTDKIGAFIPEDGGSGRYYRLAGDYDANGVITGTVEYGVFTENDPNRWVDDSTGRGGAFTGLIGQDNVLGVFISGLNTLQRVLSYRGRVNEGTNNSGFVGGFVAHRFAADNDTQNVRYTDWARWFNPRAKADTLTPKNQFLTTLRGIKTQGTTAPTAITTVTLNDDGIYYDPVTLTGDAKDGFAYFTAGDYGYVGILDSTDLGAPLRGFNGTKAIWHGQLNFRTVAKDFAININYGTGGGTVDGFSANIVDTTDFALEGTFGANGVITGLTNFAQYTGDSVGGAIIDPASAQAGILTGIIGQEGAVGVFHSTALGADGYVGGFVVHPQVVDSADVNYSDWIRGKSYLTIPTQFPQFLRTTTNKDGESEISTAVLNALPGSATSEVIELNLNNAKFGLKNTVTRQNNDVEYTTTSGDRTTTTTFSYSSNIFESAEIGLDENDGFAYFNSDNSGYVGILDTTNLGKPLVKVTGTTATWLGQLGFLHLRDNSFHDFALTITFTDTGGKIKGSVADLTLRNSTVFSIKGEFDSQGVINGSTHFTLDSRKTNIGFLTGIIGQEGAVGVFQGGGAGYSGGFVVHPDVTDNVVYADWVQANPAQLTTKDDDGVLSGLTTTGANDFEGTVLTGAFDSPLSGNHFLTTKDGVIDVGTASSDRRKNNQIQQLDLSRPFGDPIFPQYPLIPAIPNYLRFDDPENPFTHDGTTINSKAKGGIAAFTGRYAGEGDIYTYAGILDNTDLGPVLMESVEAAWNGRYVHSDFWSLQSDNFSVERDFTLNVSFDGTNGKVWAFLTNIGNEAGAGNPVEAVDIYLEGKFGFDGVISGHTIFKQYTDDVYIENDLQRAIADVIHPSNASLTLDEKPTSIDTTDSTKKQRVNPELGILTGLIGQHGAVGVWHAITNADSGGGGFIVAPPASSDVESAVEHYAAWQASFASTPAATITPAENRFLSDSDTVFDNLTTEPLGAGTTAPITTLNMETNTNNSVSFANGYFNNAGTTIRSFYALIGSNANLGATLPIWQNGQTVSATWQGTFAAGRGDGTTTNTSFDLAVDFQNRAVEAFVPITPASITHYHLRGEFPVDLNGAIIGTVDHGNFTDSNRLLPTGDNNPGVFTGLIGTRGAIGAFISGTRTDNSSTLTGGTGDTGYSGGFVARP